MTMNNFDHFNFSFLNPKLVFKSQKLNKFHRPKNDLKPKHLENFDFINKKYFLKDEKDEQVKEKKTSYAKKKVSICESPSFTPNHSAKLENLTNLIKPINDLNVRTSVISIADSQEVKPVIPVLVKDVLTLERENSNPYFWYYKKTGSVQNSCKVKNSHLLPELDKNKSTQTRSSTRESGIKSILKDRESKRLNDLSIHAFSEFKSLHPSTEEKKFSFKPKKLNEKCENYYKMDQELLNSKNFVQVEKPKTPPMVTQVSDSPKAIVKVVKENEEIEFKPNILSFAELKKLKIDERYLSDAQQMIFNPERNAFEYFEFYHLFK